LILRLEFSIPLNKFEKEKRVIELHLGGKTIRQIAPEVKMSFRDISKIIKDYDKKMRLDTNKGEKKNQTKKPSTSSQAFILYQEGKQTDEVKVVLDIPFKLALRYWKQYLKSIDMFEAFEFYQENSYDIPTFLTINNLLKINNVYGKDIVNVLRTASHVNTLNQTYYKLKTEIRSLEHKRMYYSNSNYSNYSLQPLPSNKTNYNYYHY